MKKEPKVTKPKTAKKTVKRVAKRKEDAEYWSTRPVEDMSRDWNGQTYEESKDHPHRQIILDILRELEPFAGVLEVGCNSGPNLLRIQKVYPETQLAGIDVSAGAIEIAQTLLPQAILKVADATVLPFETKQFDVVLADACYMYVDDVETALTEADRVARKAIIILERLDKKKYAYQEFLESRGYSIKITKILEDMWPTSKGWYTNGFMYVATH